MLKLSRETEMKRDRMEAVCLFVSLLALLSNRMAAGINELRTQGWGSVEH